MANRVIELLAGCALCAVPLLGAAGGAAGDACALLSPAAIQRATGEQATNVKGTAQTAGKVRQSQCFYTLPTFANSISVTLTGGSKEMWERWFHRGEDADRGEEAEAAAKAVAVKGLGDEAYWVHSFVGNLYVRKGSRFLRISLGGKMNDEERQARAKALAAEALRSLR